MKFPSLVPAFLLYFYVSQFALKLVISTSTKIKIGMIRNGHKFGAINFERFPGYALVNSTYRTVENVDVFTCVSECRKNKACHSLNFHKKSESTTLCELNELDRHAADSELAFQKQANSEYYEIKSACKGVICHNGARCVSNHKEGTWQCRCSINYAGNYCEKFNPYGAMADLGSGITNNELFVVNGQFSHETAKNVCKAFGAQQPLREDIRRIAIEAEYGKCYRAWTSEGSLGYPELNGNCGSGTNTGYRSHNCCPDKETTVANTWCIKNNFDVCKPGWYGNYKYCHLFRDDDLGTFEEAKNKCAAKNSVLAKIRFNNPSFKIFIKRVCPDCRSMYVGAEKVNGKWIWIDNQSDVENDNWGPAEPREGYNCAEYNVEINLLTTLPCNSLRGYMCRRRNV